MPYGGATGEFETLIEYPERHSAVSRDSRALRCCYNLHLLRWSSSDASLGLEPCKVIEHFYIRQLLARISQVISGLIFNPGGSAMPQVPPAMGGYCKGNKDKNRSV